MKLQDIPVSYRMGFEAGVAADSQRSNPYSAWSFDRDQWNAGYDAGYRTREIVDIASARNMTDSRNTKGGVSK